MYESFLRAPCERFNPSSTVVSARASAADDVVLDVFIAPADEFVVDDANVRTPSTPRPPGSVVPIDAIGVAVAPTRVHADVDATEHVGENPRDIAPRETSSALARASVHPLRALEKANRPMMSRAHAPSPTETTLDRVRRRSRGARIRGFRAHYFTPSRRASPRGGVTRDTRARASTAPIVGTHAFYPFTPFHSMHAFLTRTSRRDDVTRHDNTHRHTCINVCMGMHT